MELWLWTWGHGMSGVKLVVAVTDTGWFEFLRSQPNLEEANFWSPSDTNFKALEPGELFLFKLKAPINKIVGGGVFTHQSVLPVSLAWQAFREANGAASLLQMRERISGLLSRNRNTGQDFKIGCRILWQPFFLDEEDWIRPPNWSPNIVSFKTYRTTDDDGRELWERFIERASLREGSWLGEERARYGAPHLVEPRLGQGGFRTLVTDRYGRRCAITRERTLPALEAAHILPYKQGGKHETSNGLLLRRDIHSLFDDGYVTVTPDYRFEVSRRIKEEYENGRDYYKLHGSAIHLPANASSQPDRTKLRWHNDSVYLG